MGNRAPELVVRSERAGWLALPWGTAGGSGSVLAVGAGGVDGEARSVQGLWVVVCGGPMMSGCRNGMGFPCSFCA